MPDQATLRELFESVGVRFAYLFGSRARGEEQPGSDIDIAVWYSPDYDCMQRFQLNCKLQEKLESVLEQSLDLLILNDATPPMQNEAVLRGKPLYPDNREEVVRFEARLRLRYEDYAYSQRFFTQARRARMSLK